MQIKPVIENLEQVLTSTNHFGAIFLAVAVVSITMQHALSAPNPHGWENWKTDFSKVSVPLHEIQSGGPSKDGIPAIDDPKFVAIDAVNIKDNEPVIGFSHNGEAKAYPLSVLMWHEIANDMVGGHPFAITYCPLCNAAIVFDAQFEGQRLDFGTTGRLRNSDLLMYDRQSESWWQQFSGEALIGEHVGKKLKIVPSRLESFAEFKKRFPKGLVLVPNDPDFREYGRNPYVQYDGRSAPYPFYSGEMPTGINPMARVVVIRKDGEVKNIIALDKIVTEKEVARGNFKLSWKPGRSSALDSARISAGREIGNLVVTETVDGEPRDAVHDLTFAFVAHAFHPDVSIEQ